MNLKITVRDVTTCNVIGIHRRFRRKLLPPSSEYNMIAYSSEMSENTRLWRHIWEDIVSIVRLQDLKNGCDYLIMIRTLFEDCDECLDLCR
jgi:hypothetical protein